MKLLELLEELFIGEKAIMSHYEMGDINYKRLTPQYLESFKEKLLTLDEFKNVKQLNILDKPFIQVDVDSVPDLIPALLLPDNFEFEEVVDLFSIELTPDIYDTKNLGIGVWKSPTLYDPKTFEVIKEIKIIWSPDQLMDSKINEEEIIEGMLGEVRELLTNGKNSNYPVIRSVIVRCSNRSYKGEYKK